jgi:hypothetical protein
MVRNLRIYFATKRVVHSSSKPRITISRSSSDRSWRSRACHLEKSLTTLISTWTLTRCLYFLPGFFFCTFFLYHTLGYISILLSTSLARLGISLLLFYCLSHSSHHCLLHSTSSGRIGSSRIWNHNWYVVISRLLVKLFN